MSSIKIKQISVSNNFVYALSEDGDIYKYFNNNIYSQELSCNKSNLNNIKNTKDFFQLNGKFRYCLLISSGLKHNTTNLNKNIEIIYSCIGK